MHFQNSEQLIHIISMPLPDITCRDPLSLHFDLRWVVVTSFSTQPLW